MNRIPTITSADVTNKLNWSTIVDALHRGHELTPAKIGDQLIENQDDCLLSRAAWVQGLGIGVKSVTAMPNNNTQGLPTIHGAMLVFEDVTGQLQAVIDSDVVTYWKTAGDSVFAAKLLARPNSKRLLIVGAGTVAQSLVRAYSEIFPQLELIEIWNRTFEKAEQLARKLTLEGFAVNAVGNLEQAVSHADIVSVATLSYEPVIKGAWVSSGTHVDLIGAFRPTMREADDALLSKAKIFVDSRATTIEHIGELMIPISNGVITPNNVLADFYDLVNKPNTGRQNPQEITVFKNGGGAHLDLMTASVIVEAANI